MDSSRSLSKTRPAALAGALAGVIRNMGGRDASFGAER
jgi:stage V sporulation protein SpoVS